MFLTLIFAVDFPLFNAEKTKNAYADCVKAFDRCSTLLQSRKNGFLILRRIGRRIPRALPRPYRENAPSPTPVIRFQPTADFSVNAYMGYSFPARIDFLLIFIRFLTVLSKTPHWAFKQNFVLYGIIYGF